jgi:hypothetical protein
MIRTAQPKSDYNVVVGETGRVLIIRESSYKGTPNSVIVRDGALWQTAFGKAVEIFKDLPDDLSNALAEIKVVSYGVVTPDGRIIDWADIPLEHADAVT